MVESDLPANGLLYTLGLGVEVDDESLIVSAGGGAADEGDNTMLEIFETKHRNAIAMILGEQKVREEKRT